MNTVSNTKASKLARWAVGILTAALLGVGGAPFASAEVCGTNTWTLWAGQTNDVGIVTVENDQDNLYVTYTLTLDNLPDDGLGNIGDGQIDAEFGTLHLWVGEDLADLPRTPAPPNGPNAGEPGAPIQGQFPYKSGEGLPSATGETTYTFTIPLASIIIGYDPEGACPSLPLYVVAHAEVNYRDESGFLTGGGDTAYGGDHEVNVNEPGRWWYYGQYTVCCDGGNPQLCYAETAFGKGNHVFTTHRKSNPEGLPSLNLTKNRWGWADYLTEQHMTYDIWAGAGLNKTANGDWVGTLTVEWDGSQATFTYDLTSSSMYLEEVHIYAGDMAPATIAPGQYGYPTEGYDVGGVVTFTYTVPVADVDGDGGIWLIAHAAVSNGYCE